jgi:hypothetical protein
MLAKRDSVPANASLDSPRAVSASSNWPAFRRVMKRVSDSMTALWISWTAWGVREGRLELEVLHGPSELLVGVGEDHRRLEVAGDLA